MADHFIIDCEGWQKYIMHNNSQTRHSMRRVKIYFIKVRASECPDLRTTFF